MTEPGRSGQVVVCGLHADGLRTIEQLHLAGVRLVVVDDDPDVRLVGVLTGWGIPLVHGDSRLPETLTAAGVDDALALVCVESDDLHTLATALLVRRRRPDLRVVVQLRNAAVGRALTTAGVVVLDTARLAAPAVVEACLPTGVHHLRLGDDDFVVAQLQCAAEGTLRSLYGDLAPLAVIPAGAAAAEWSPGRDRQVGPGDQVVVVGTPSDLAVVGVRHPALQRRRPQRSGFVGARAPRPVRHRPAALFGYLLRTLDRRFLLAFAALGLLAGVSITTLLVGYQEPDGRRMSAVDAVYFTVETIGTVGYGDFSFRQQPVWLRLWAVCLMIVGATLAATFFALLTNLLISRTIEDSLGRRKVTGLNDHVVVVGLGSVGLEVVDRLLAQGTDVVVVESDGDNRFLAQVRARQVPVVVADATLPETLAEVRLHQARAVAVLTSDDLVNIETALAVRDQLGERWADVPVVLRIFDRQMAQTVEAGFDFRYVRSTAELAAPWFVGAALGLDVLNTFYVGAQPMLVARLVVRVGAELDGLRMGDLPFRIRVVSLVRAATGTAEHPPRRDTRFEAGDVAHLVGPYEELLRLLLSPVVATLG